MKLKKLGAIGHNAAHSYFSTGHIGQDYACTVLYRLALQHTLFCLELDVLNTELRPIQPIAVEASLVDFRQQFFDMLGRENIPAGAVISYKILVERRGDRMDVVAIRCKPELADLNGKIYSGAEILLKYPAPVR